MTSISSDTISTRSELQQEERPDLSDEVERGISQLRRLTSMDTRLSSTSSHQPREPRVCLPGSTSRLVRKWLSESPGSASNILWLSGLPISTNTEDITAICHGYCHLAACFSFSSRRGSEQVEELVPALALQICSNIPGLRPVIGLTALHHPYIFSRGLHSQLEALIFNPFRHYLSMKDDLPVVLMIDGLELYYDVDTQKWLISIIETVATTATIPLRFLLTTRQSSKEYGLPLQPGTHLRVHHTPSASRLQRLQSALRLRASQGPNIPAYHGFPQLLQTQICKSDAESYARSLIMLGHGVPLWRPQEGPQIGDVMFVTRDGNLEFLVNIFRGHDEPMNDGRQGMYTPLTLDPSEVTRVENYFMPGTVITSPGIIASKKCDTPLSVNFKSNVEEGGILLLPEGASREDIKSTARFHKYVQRWAPYWYRYQDLANGSIFLVTGSDKATDYACATFFSASNVIGTREIDMDFLRHKDGEHPWHKQGRARAHCYRWSRAMDAQCASPWTATSPEQVSHLCVFIRGMRIALSSAVWSSIPTRSIFAPSSVPACTNVLHKPQLLPHAAGSLLVHIHCRASERDALWKVWWDTIIFHPIFVLGPDLLRTHPKASVVVINDSDWGMLTQEGHGDWIHMKALMNKLYQHFSVVEDHGVVSLSPKSAHHKDVKAKRRIGIPQIFRWNEGTVKAVKPVPIGKFVHDLGETSDSDY